MELSDRKSPNTVAVRFRRHKVAVASLVIIAVLGFAAIFAPFIAIQDPYTVDLDSIGSRRARTTSWAPILPGAICGRAWYTAPESRCR